MRGLLHAMLLNIALFTYISAAESTYPTLTAEELVGLVQECKANTLALLEDEKAKTMASVRRVKERIKSLLENKGIEESEIATFCDEELTNVTGITELLARDATLPIDKFDMEGLACLRRHMMLLRGFLKENDFFASVFAEIESENIAGFSSSYRGLPKELFLSVLRLQTFFRTKKSLEDQCQ